MAKKVNIEQDLEYVAELMHIAVEDYRKKDYDAALCALDEASSVISDCIDPLEHLDDEKNK